MACYVAFFLITRTGISVLDVVASLLVFCGFIYAYFKTRWFLAVVDGATLEVSDFSILVRGLPKDSTAVEVSALVGLAEGGAFCDSGCCSCSHQ